MKQELDIVASYESEYVMLQAQNFACYVDFVVAAGEGVEEPCLLDCVIAGTGAARSVVAESVVAAFVVFVVAAELVVRVVGAAAFVVDVAAAVVFVVVADAAFVAPTAEFAVILAAVFAVVFAAVVVAFVVFAGAVVVFAVAAVVYAANDSSETILEQAPRVVVAVGTLVPFEVGDYVHYWNEPSPWLVQSESNDFVAVAAAASTAVLQMYVHVVVAAAAATVEHAGDSALQNSAVDSYTAAAVVVAAAVELEWKVVNLHFDAGQERWVQVHDWKKQKTVARYSQNMDHVTIAAAAAVLVVVAAASAGWKYPAVGEQVQY